MYIKGISRSFSTSYSMGGATDGCRLTYVHSYASMQMDALSVIKSN
ncbi:MAG: hypothetical protein J6I46_15320 [Ruminococcus sp.]|nr:hypothetical protein [Ruminococcus sp.]MBP3799127.1 hypothetical protein [Ruminococcus sp.]